MKYVLEPKKKQIRIVDIDWSDRWQLIKTILNNTDLIITMPDVRIVIRK